MKIVIKLGGHLFSHRPSPKKISAYVVVLKKIREMGHKLVVVTGGGIPARQYIIAARKLGASEFACDLIGIHVSRLNARLLIANLGKEAYPDPVTTLTNLRKAFETNKIVVLGGLQPGQSTNAVGILSAEAVNADLFINATTVDGVYTTDPETDPKAKKLDEIKTDKLLKMVLANKLSAGGYILFDLLAIKLVERSGIPTRIIDGRKPSNLLEVVKGKVLGTLIVSTLK